MNTDYICAVCCNPAPHIAFCAIHTPGWLHSDERKQVDFSDESSYNDFVTKYSNRVKNGETLPGEDRASENDQEEEVKEELHGL